jgi:hypothetical protein
MMQIDRWIYWLISTLTVTARRGTITATKRPTCATSLRLRRAFA